jgi:hypothetical protein
MKIENRKEALSQRLAWDVTSQANLCGAAHPQRRTMRKLVLLRATPDFIHKLGIGQFVVTAKANRDKKGR